MTLPVDDLTAIMVSIAYLLMGTIMLAKAWGSRRWVGRMITGLSAWGVAIIYAAPALFDVPVVDIREALRLALFLFAVNYVVLHREDGAAALSLLKRWVTWKLHRS